MFKTFRNKVTIILATRNEEKNIDIVLESLIDQNFTDYNIIVTDRSTDNTLMLASNFIQKIGSKLNEKNIHIQLLSWDDN